MYLRIKQDEYFKHAFLVTDLLDSIDIIFFCPQWLLLLWSAGKLNVS